MRLYCALLVATLFTCAERVEAQVPYNPARVLQIVNTSTSPDSIFGIYVTPTTVNAWGMNLLGCCVAVPPANTVYITVPDGAQCLVDIRVVFKSGRVKEKYGANICTHPAWNFWAE
jgi:hypothetical protein